MRQRTQFFQDQPMPRMSLEPRLFIFLTILLICALPQMVEAQQTGNTAADQATTTQSGTEGAGGLTLDRPNLTTNIDELTQEQESGFIGTSDINNEFLGVNAAGENASNQTNRQFNTRTQNRNVNQGTQTQPLYRTFGPNNTPYRSPLKVGFQVNRARDRSVDLTLNRNVRILSSRRPQFSEVQFLVTATNTVTLRGSVASDDDLKMAMLYVKMEPGVDRVINELEVAEAKVPTPPTPAVER